MTQPAPLRILSPLHRATRQIGLAFEQRMRDLDAQGTECHLLSYLRSYAPCAVGELVRVFGLKRSTMTSMLDRLEARRLLRRDVAPDDGRSYLVTLTPKGARAADRINAIVRTFERDVLARLSTREMSGFEAVLEAIAHETAVVVRQEKTG